MAKIKHTKNELKAQREALARYERFLPMLQLKKQQLQAEIQRIEALVAERQQQERQILDAVQSWAALLSEDQPLEQVAVLEEIVTTTGNIAGVSIPVLEDLKIRMAQIDLFATPTWLDDAVAALDQLIRLRVERETLEEQSRRVAEELRVTSQRVNLFEKVKIPESRENIRIIRIFLGDEQTAAVARGKIAKQRTGA